LLFHGIYILTRKTTIIILVFFTLFNTIYISLPAAYQYPILAILFNGVPFILLIRIVVLRCKNYFQLKQAGEMEWLQSKHYEVENALNTRNREMQLLFEAGKELSETLELKTIYRTVFRVISESMACNTLIVSTYNEDDHLIRCAYVNHQGEEHDTSNFPPIPLEIDGQGTQSIAIHTGESLFINDFQARLHKLRDYYVNDEGQVQEETPEEEGTFTQSALIVPLKLQNKVYGVLQIQSVLLNAYSPKNLELLEALAPQVAAASNNARLYATAQHEINERRRAESAEKEQRHYAEALRDTAVALTSTFDINELFDLLLENVSRIIPYDGINITLFDAGISRYVRIHGKYTDYYSESELYNITFSIERTPTLQKIIETKELYYIPDTTQNPTWQVYPEISWIKSHIATPLVIGNEVIGCLNVDAAQPNFFTSSHVNRLKAFAHYAAAAIHNVRLYQELSANNELLEHAVAIRTTELQLANEQVSAILENSPDAILLLNTQGMIINHNPISLQIFNSPTNQLKGHVVNYLSEDKHKQDLKHAIFNVVQQGKRMRLVTKGIKQSDTTFDAEIALAPIYRNGAVSNIICSIHDISQLKEVERLKDAFVSNVSHELRTPIASLRLHHDLILRVPEKTPIYLDRMNREIDRLNVIIEDLLKISRLDQNRMVAKLHPINVVDVINQYINDRQALTAEKGITLVYKSSASSLHVLADSGMLGQVLSILLTNAINYTPENGRIEIGTELQESSDPTMVGIWIRDTGPGISLDEQPLIFERFYRGEVGQSSGAPGTGLGLSIAKEMIDRHYGRIEVASSGIPGDGSTFTIWLPALTSAQMAETATHRPQST
jgi:PAS domain S-box-containing protein